MKWGLKPCPYSKNYDSNSHYLTILLVQVEDFSTRQKSGPWYVACSCTAGGPICPTQEEAARKHNEGQP